MLISVQTNMETCCQSQRFAGNNNYSNYYSNNPGYQQQSTQNAKQNQFSVQSYQKPEGDSNQPEQPPMPPEAEAVLGQLKTMPCPMTYFPPGMMNGQGFNNPMSAGSNMFQQGNMYGDFSGTSGNPHSSNNAQLHAQNFQLHRDLHGMDGYSNPHNNQGQQSNVESGLSNARQQHAANPQLHAQNFLMHQKLHGVGNPGNQGPQHAKSSKSDIKSNQPRGQNALQTNANQQQAMQTAQTNYGNQYLQNYQTPYSNMGDAKQDMGQHSMGQQEMNQRSMMQYPDGQPKHTTCQNPECQHSAYYGSYSGDQYSTNQVSTPCTCRHSVNSQMGQQFVNEQPFTDMNSNEHLKGHQEMSLQPNAQQSMDQHAVPCHHQVCHHAKGLHSDDSRDQHTTHAHAVGSHKIAQYQMDDNQTMHKNAHPGQHSVGGQFALPLNFARQESIPVTETHNTHHHPAQTHIENKYHNTYNASQQSNEPYNYMHSDEPRYTSTEEESYPQYRNHDDSRQMQELICPAHEPNLTVVRRSEGMHEHQGYTGDGVLNNSGEIYSSKPHIHQNFQHTLTSGLSDSMPANTQKNNGLQGIRSAPGISPKGWVIGPRLKKTKSDWTRH